ncbi:hypothetical protein SETIT_1G067500v2 [Setaria italica]|uniref:Uncharacterized protein n=1 Tax=Setaria italica TaxID=4555 RepID=A0A368PID3_SETIT|nr:hypothetical protein SETIT_1G067500v2 [Setaria italica]
MRSTWLHDQRENAAPSQPPPCLVGSCLRSSARCCFNICGGEAHNSERRCACAAPSAHSLLLCSGLSDHADKLVAD